MLLKSDYLALSTTQELAQNAALTLHQHCQLVFKDFQHRRGRGEPRRRTSQEATPLTGFNTALATHKGETINVSLKPRHSITRHAGTAHTNNPRTAKQSNHKLGGPELKPTRPPNKHAAHRIYLERHVLLVRLRELRPSQRLHVVLHLPAGQKTHVGGRSMHSNIQE